MATETRFIEIMGELDRLCLRLRGNDFSSDPKTILMRQEKTSRDCTIQITKAQFDDVTREINTLRLTQDMAGLDHRKITSLGVCSFLNTLDGIFRCRSNERIEITHHFMMATRAANYHPLSPDILSKNARANRGFTTQDVEKIYTMIAEAYALSGIPPLNPQFLEAADTIMPVAPPIPRRTLDELKQPSHGPVEKPKHAPKQGSIIQPGQRQRNFVQRALDSFWHREP